MTKHNGAILNPCLKEQDQSYECLNKNNFDQEKCAPYFDNYNICKKFWGKVYNDRKARGIFPLLPPIEERDAIKKQYLDYINERKEELNSKAKEGVASASPKIFVNK